MISDTKCLCAMCLDLRYPLLLSLLCFAIYSNYVLLSINEDGYAWEDVLLIDAIERLVHLETPYSWLQT